MGPSLFHGYFGGRPNDAAPEKDLIDLRSCGEPERRDRVRRHDAQANLGVSGRLFGGGVWGRNSKNTKFDY